MQKRTKARHARQNKVVLLLAANNCVKAEACVTKNKFRDGGILEREEETDSIDVAGSFIHRQLRSDTVPQRDWAPCWSKMAVGLTVLHGTAETK